MELRNITSFLKTVEVMSFSKAASELGYSQSAITMQMKQLETELDVKLFDRINKRIQLTEDGKKFLYYANEIQTITNNAQNALSKNDAPTGEIRIGFYESVCTAILTKLLNTYHSLYPDVTTIIKIGTFSELSYMLNSNQVDIIWIFDTPISSYEWVKAVDYEKELALICSPDNALTKNKTLMLEDVVNEPFILTEKTCSYRTLFENAITALGHNLNVFLEIGNTEIVKEFVSANLGLSILPAFTVQTELQNRYLNILNVTDFKMTMHGQIFYHKNKWLTACMKEFIRLAEEIIKLNTTTDENE